MENHIKEEIDDPLDEKEIELQCDFEANPTPAEKDPLELDGHLKNEIKVDTLNTENTSEEHVIGEGVTYNIRCIMCNKYCGGTDLFQKLLGIYCSGCYETFKKKSQEEWVMKLSGLYHSCTVCANVFYNSLKFMKHDCSCKNLFQCNYCCVSFDRKKDIVKHLKKCGDWLSSQVSKKKRMVKCEKKTLNCDYCEKVFTSSSNLNRHLKIHAGIKPYACRFCEMTFMYESYLKTHLQSHYGQKLFCCEVCGKTFTRNGNLKTHSRIHNGIKPITCDICKKTFISSSHLKRHLRTHNKEKPFGCDLCKKTFSRGDNLKTHLLTHNGIKPLSCDICGKAFITSSHLKTHLRVHNDEKPFSCDKCQKSFKLNHHLKAHQRTHI